MNYFIHAEESGVVPMAVFSLEPTSPFRGIPTEVASLTPAELRGCGLVAKQVGPPVEVVKFALQNGVHLQLGDVQYACRALHIDVPLLPGETGRSKRTFMSALIKHAFPDDSLEARAQIAADLLQADTKKSETNDPATKAALECLDPSEKHFFEDIAGSDNDDDADHDGGAAIHTRAHTSHAAPVNYTKRAIKDLAPGRRWVRHGAEQY